MAPCTSIGTPAIIAGGGGIVTVRTLRFRLLSRSGLVPVVLVEGLLEELPRLRVKDDDPFGLHEAERGRATEPLERREALVSFRRVERPAHQHRDDVAARHLEAARVAVGLLGDVVDRSPA